MNLSVQGSALPTAPLSATLQSRVPARSTTAASYKFTIVLFQKTLRLEPMAQSSFVKQKHASERNGCEREHTNRDRKRGYSTASREESSTVAITSPMTRRAALQAPAHKGKRSATVLLKLDPGGLANNGGPTNTVAELEGSVSVDAVSSTECGNLANVDQRGKPRPDPAKTGRCPATFARLSYWSRPPLQPPQP